MIPTATGQERSVGKQMFSDAIVAKAKRACVDSEDTQGKLRRIADMTVNLAYDVSRRNFWWFRLPRYSTRRYGYS